MTVYDYFMARSKRVQVSLSSLNKKVSAEVIRESENEFRPNALGRRFMDTRTSSPGF